MKKQYIAIIFVSFLILLLFMGGASYYALQPADKGNIIVYGSKTCPWCVKQEAYLNQNGIPYNFVDCRTGQCPEFVQGFPTIMRDGQILNGYTEF